MSTIQGKEWYRNTFLKSDEWKLFRSEKLSDQGAKCFVCKKVDTSNDVHHIWYGEYSMCGYMQFVVLCRICHEAVHTLFDPCAARNETEKKEAYGNFLIAKEKILKVISKSPKREKQQSSPRIYPAPERCPSCLRSGLELKYVDLTGMSPSPDIEMAKKTWVCQSCHSRIERTLGNHFYTNKSAAWKDIKKCFKAIREDGLTYII